MRIVSIFAALCIVGGAAAVPARAQDDYPARPVTVIVPYAAGGPTDSIARLTAEGMGRELGKQFVVENVTGAGGTLASTRVARSDPDGYTLMVHHIGISTAPALYRKLAFDTKTAFAPIGLISDAPSTVIARPDFPANTFPELIAKIKAEKGSLTYAHAGLGASSHLCGTLFQQAIGVQMTTVPYKGNGPILTDLMGKQIDITCDQTTNTTGPIKEGKVKGYAVTANKRVAQLPDVPTSEEGGLKGFEMSTWHGIYAPAGTPDAVIAKLSAALQKTVTDPAFVDRLAKISTTAASKEDATPEALKKRLFSEIDRWSPIIKAAGQFAD
ncbi:tripartite tricarboxylate transporter substrate binding protein BugD [Chelatococcus sambhunathii]|uniref:Tripartite tricarboxylate transporter substrate binding protein BugD n=1 Tax=Chelatococcus sambhunathii TaxID=363953 RepID=A0ABU1DKQ6_9HYPH|nr:tripartite tricarboxylate transporter substrate-binding protein [Chelatococcus sambhunathii]MDR4308714.1 tripartite tricarboxylate transporter substrate binding protein BugD [Chelatococcus sambhunathii]